MSSKIKIKKPHKSEMYPVGYHVVHGHVRICKSGTRTWVDTHLRKNRGRKTMHLSENILHLYWNNKKKYPKLKAIKPFQGYHELDNIIQFWLEYWKNQGVSFPKDLTPLHIKAIIAAESSFNPKVKAKTSTATGLMQVLKSSLAPLAGKKRQGWREVPDNYISVTQKELEDPVINIAAGVRWFGHKNYLMRNHKNVTLKKVIRNYHSRDKAGDEYAEKVLKYYNDSK